MAEKDAEIWTLSFFRLEKVRKFELCNFLCRKKCRMLDFIIFIGKKIRKVGLRKKMWKVGRFGALKSDFFRNACIKSGSLRFSQFSGCWLILSVYILCLYEFWLSLCKIARSSVILLLPLFWWRNSLENRLCNILWLE